jgi:general L-amino acid transport system substrate-binding protein
MRLSVHRVLCSTAAFGLLALGCFASASADATVLDAIRTRGHVVCGVGDGPKGYSTVNAQGIWSGINVDFCRALAAAVLGNRDAVQFRLLPAGERFAALQSREIDVLSRNVAITSSLDTTLGIRFPGVLVYDGQGFLVRKAQNVSSALELSGARVCVTTETSDAQGVADFFNGLKIPYDLQKFEKWTDAAMAYANKSCQVLSADVSVLAMARQAQPDAGEHIILPELASKQPVGPAIRQGDDEWFSVVRWTIYALIAAEELGINSGNVDAMKTSGGSEARRFLGSDLELGKQLGLSADWTQRLIKQIGNYGELFDRNLGLKSPLKLERRQNNLAANGGLHYAPSFR